MRTAVCAQQVQGRRGTALHWGRPHLPSMVPQQVPEAVVPVQLPVLLLRHGEALASAPSLELRHSRALLGPRSCCCFTQQCRAVTSHPSGCAGRSCSKLCAELRAQHHVWSSDSGATGPGPSAGAARYLPQLWQKWCSPTESFPKCSTEVAEYKGSAHCPVQFLEPDLDVALHYNVGWEF